MPFLHSGVAGHCHDTLHTHLQDVPLLNKALWTWTLAKEFDTGEKDPEM